jgi:hypothetical protein
VHITFLLSESSGMQKKHPSPHSAVLFLFRSREFGYGFEAVGIRVKVADNLQFIPSLLQT